MNKVFCIVLALLPVISLNAQLVQRKSPSTLPAFHITQPDGRPYGISDLPAGKPVMFVYFDPDCDHCEAFIDKLIKQINSFKNAQIVMVTYVPVGKLKTFVQKTGLEKYPSIITGTEGNAFIIRYHYDVVQFPYVALHDPNGNLIATYESEVPPPEDLAKILIR